jgi:acyl-CoA dehydrogenase
MRAPPPCSDDVIERAFCDADVVREAWTTASRLAPEACRVEQTSSSPEVALPAIVRFLGERGLLGLVVPSALGGAFEDVRSVALCLARERLGHASPLVELAFAMQALGSHPITARGSDAQKSQWLPGVAAGELVAAFALTEAEAGSDLGGIETTARRDGESYVLDGEKILISNAGIASFYVVFAATADKTEKRRLSAFIVDGKSKGLDTKRTRVLGGHPIGSVFLEGVRVPASQRIGEEGDGLAVALETLHKLRPTVGAAAVGLAQRALDETVRHVRARKQFGVPLADQQAVQMHLANMALDVEGARLLVYRAAAVADVVAEIRRSGAGRESDAQRAHLGRTASMGKLAATEAAFRVIDTGLQLHGGRGVIEGSVIARLYEDIRALRIYEGASDVQRSLIARDVLRE